MRTTLGGSAFSPAWPPFWAFFFRLGADRFPRPRCGLMLHRPCRQAPAAGLAWVSGSPAGNRPGKRREAGNFLLRIMQTVSPIDVRSRCGKLGNAIDRCSLLQLSWCVGKTRREYIETDSAVAASNRTEKLLVQMDGINSPEC